MVLWRVLLCITAVTGTTVLAPNVHHHHHHHHVRNGGRHHRRRHQHKHNENVDGPAPRLQLWDYNMPAASFGHIRYFVDELIPWPPIDNVIPLWPIKREAIVEGDLVLGGLMMVHEREDTQTCGPIMPQGGIQAVETMLYTLDIINERLRRFKIGAHILDDCDKDTYGLEMAVDFIKGM